jgi:hypothetical protein
MSFGRIKTQHQEIQWFNLNFSTSILVIKHNATINMPLKWHHIGIYVSKCNLKYNLTWFLACCFVISPIYNFVSIFFFATKGSLMEYDVQPKKIKMEDLGLLIVKKTLWFAKSVWLKCFSMHLCPRVFFPSKK